MSAESRQSKRWRMPLFVALLAMGVGYIIAFVFLVRHSIDFIARDRIASAITAASTRGDVVGDELVFKQDSTDLHLLATGWQAADDAGTWSEGEGGTLYLPSGFGVGATVEVRFDGHLNLPDREMQVMLDVDGQQIASWQLDHDHWQITDQVAMPTHATGAAARQLRFRIARPERPLWLGYAPGLLAYGVHMYYLRIVQPSVND